MAYEMKPDSFSFQFNPDNIDKKYPALKLQMKIGDDLVELPCWVRDGKYGMSFSGNTPELITFLLAAFGRYQKKTQPQDQEQQQQPQQAQRPNPEPPKDTNPSSLIK